MTINQNEENRFAGKDGETDFFDHSEESAFHADPENEMDGDGFPDETGEETEAGFAGEADGEQERILRKSAGKIMELLSVCRRKAEKLLEKESGMEKLLLKVERKISRVPKAGGFLKYIPEMILLIRSYIRNEYRDIPKWQIIELTASLIYFLMPLDAIPDAIPVLGWIDDAFTVLFTIRWFRETIDKYMTWREVFGRNHPEDRKLLEGLAAAAGEEKEPEKG